MICRNCTHTFEGNYCSNCGDKAVVERFSLKKMTYDAVVVPFKEHRKGLPVTIKELTINPGNSVRDYVEGNRNSLYACDKFLLLAGALTIVLNFRYHFFVSEITNAESASNQMFLSLLNLQDKKEFFSRFFLYAEEYATIVNIIAIPIFSFFSFLFFKKKGYNFGEDLVVNTYITAQQLFFLVLLTPPILELFPESKASVMSVYIILIALYNIWVYMQFFKEMNFKGLFKSILVVVISQVVAVFANIVVYYCLGRYFQLLDQWKVI